MDWRKREKRLGAGVVRDGGALAKQTGPRIVASGGTGNPRGGAEPQSGDGSDVAHV